MNKILFAFSFFFVNIGPGIGPGLVNTCSAQSHQAILVLTYDDALASQLDIAIPQLDSAKLTATFFLTGGAEQKIPQWRAVAQKGYELGNHTYYHPCQSSGKHSSKDYTVSAILNEIAHMNDVLHTIDGKTGRTYAYPCTETAVGGVNYVDTLKRSGLVKYARLGGDSSAMVTDTRTIDPMRVPCWIVAGNYTGADLIAYVKRLQQKGGLGVFLFHGVGGDYITTSAEAHRELLGYLSAHRDEVRVMTFRDAMDFIR